MHDKFVMSSNCILNEEIVKYLCMFNPALKPALATGNLRMVKVDVNQPMYIQNLLAFQLAMGSLESFPDIMVHCLLLC